MKVLISGAGIAGLTAAFWLRRFGFTPTIVERADSLVVGGYKIDVRGSAVEVLRRMGLYDAVVASSTHMQGSILVDRDGAIISRMDADAFGHRTGDDIEIVRGTLCRLLRDHTADVKIRFSDAIDSIAQTEGQTEGQARVTFAGGHSEIFDLVIGADGLHSNVRTIVFGEESRFLRDLGIYLCVFSVPNYLDLDRVEVQYSEVGRIAQIWSTRDSAGAKACFGFAAPAQPIGLRDRPQQENAIRIAYDGVKWEVPRLLDMMSGASDWYFDVAAQTDMPSWTKGRVALAGDAGYCPSPMSGQGSSLALIGSYVLAGELAAASGDHRVAFAEYERTMRPFVNANQELGRQSARFMRSRAGEDSTELSGSEVESVIGAATERIAIAARSIAMKDYALLR